MASQSNVNFIDNPHAPEVYATGATGFFIEGGNVHITFEAMRVDHSTSPGPTNRVVVGRLVMPGYAVLGLVSGLGDFLEKHKVAAPDLRAPPGPKH